MVRRISNTYKFWMKETVRNKQRAVLILGNIFTYDNINEELLLIEQRRFMVFKKLLIIRSNQSSVAEEVE